MLLFVFKCEGDFEESEVGHVGLTDYSWNLVLPSVRALFSKSMNEVVVIHPFIVVSPKHDIVDLFADHAHQHNFSAVQMS